MGTEVGGLQVDRLLLIELTDGFELLQLVIGRQAVAALALDARYAQLEHAIEARQVLGHEVVERGAADGPRGAADSAAGFHDLQVRLAAYASDELAAAVADKGDVRVGVDQPGDYAAAVGGQRGRALVERGVAGRSEPSDASVADDEGGIVDAVDFLESGAGERARRHDCQGSDLLD